MVEMVDPQLGESVLDPPCGTGGFLNTLSRPLKDWKTNERKDVIVTNPPFGDMEEDGIEKNFPKATQTRETADLFLQLIIRILKPHGRAAIVLPDGTLFGEGVKTKIKQKLLEECNLHTIVRLPNSVFAPYTGIKTNLLFFEKGMPTREIWYYEHQLPKNVKAYNKTKPMSVGELDGCRKWWGSKADGFASRKETEQAWKVNITEIIERNFNLDIKNPHVAEVINHDPDKLLATYHQHQEEISQLQNQLKTILGEALGNGGCVDGTVKKQAKKS